MINYNDLDRRKEQFLNEGKSIREYLNSLSTEETIAEAKRIFSNSFFKVYTMEDDLNSDKSRECLNIFNEE